MKNHAGVIIIAAVLAGTVFTGCGTEENISIKIAEKPAVTNAVATEAVTEAETTETEEEVTDAEETTAVSETTTSDEAEVTDEEDSDPEVTEETGITEPEAEPAVTTPYGFSRVTKDPRPGSAGPLVSSLEGRWEDGEGNVIEFKNCSDYAGDFVMTSSEGTAVTGRAYVEYNFDTDNYAVFWYNLYNESNELVYSFRYTGEIPLETLRDMNYTTFERADQTPGITG
ncbi:MAG: hypothetical protein J6P89_06490 [Oscillospiraceae bacterium]|nr:hypothetical protein [Oscillospiraceae bacterium]